MSALLQIAQPYTSVNSSVDDRFVAEAAVLILVGVPDVICSRIVAPERRSAAWVFVNLDVTCQDGRGCGGCERGGQIASRPWTFQHWA